MLLDKVCFHVVSGESGVVGLVGLQHFFFFLEESRFW